MEKKCSICGVSESQAKLKSAIDGREMILACSKCIEMEELIPVNKPTEEQLTYANKRYTVRETLARAMGSRKEAKAEAKPVSPEAPALYCISSYRKTEFPIKLVDNFHWKIMMARKAKKISQDLLARQIGEQLIVVKTLESGCITRDSERIIKKIEDVLGINLREDSPMYQSPQKAGSPSTPVQKSEQDGKVLVTRENVRTLKVGDLIRVREEIETRKNRPEVSMPELEELEESNELIDIDEGKA